MKDGHLLSVLEFNLRHPLISLTRSKKLDFGAGEMHGIWKGVLFLLHHAQSRRRGGYTPMGHVAGLPRVAAYQFQTGAN